MRVTTVATVATVGAFAGLAGLHVAWGVGSSFPFDSRDDLAEAVIGSSVVPGLPESVAVAGCLAVAAVLVADVGSVPTPVRRLGVLSVATVLATRAAFGFAGATERLVPGSNAARFVRLDRRVYAPLCALLAAGSAWSLTARR